MPLNVYLLVVNCSKTGTKNFTSLYTDVYKEHKIGRKDGQLSTHFRQT